MAYNYPYAPQFTYPGANYALTANNYQPTGGPVNNLFWVSGETGAKSYPMAPNSNALLMDTEDSKFYIKSVDLLGAATIRTYEYKEVQPEPVTPKEAPAAKPAAENITATASDYVSREEFEKLKKSVDDLLS